MNMRFCFGILILLCATTLNVSAGLISSSGANLVDQIKPNLTTRSKPTTSPYPKYASVSFLQPETKLDFNGGEPDARTMQSYRRALKLVLQAYIGRKCRQVL